MDELEKYIRENRTSFDDEFPADKVWERINRRIPSESIGATKSNMISLFTRMAAAFVVVLASGIVIGYYINGRQSSAAIDDPIFQEYIDVEKKYVKEINHKMNALSVHEVDPQVNRDLMQLDAVYEELKKELYEGQAINNGKIIEALLTNYQEKVEILEIVLSRVQTPSDDINLKTLRDDSLSL